MIIKGTAILSTKTQKKLTLLKLKAHMRKIIEKEKNKTVFASMGDIYQEPIE